MIDAYEGIEVSTFDFPGAYLHADVSKDKNILLKYRGAFVEIMCWINSYHKKNASYKNEQKFLYMLVLCAIYGWIEFNIQWYKLYSEKLMEKGFELNPYERCVANKIMNDK